MPEEEKSQSAEAEIRPGWSEPQPKELPRPTFWPFVLAVGVILALWGIVTSHAISLVGVGVIAVAIAGWIGELRREPEA